MTILAESDRLLLRKFELSDAEAYYEMTRDKSIQDYVPYAHLSSLNETIQCIKYSVNGDFTNYLYVAIEEKQTGKLIGAIIATRTFPLTFDINILIHKDYRNQGYMSEALQHFIPTMPQGSELIFVIDKNNKASFNTVTKIPNIIEKPFKGSTKEIMYRFSLIV